MLCGETIINQDTLVATLKKLFSEEVVVNARKSSAIKYPETESYLELDAWIPSLNLCFEFQDTHHYFTTWYSQAPTTLVQKWDNTKQNLVFKNGMDLVVVPCWWDGSPESLISSIKFLRPELLTLSVRDAPISLNPPKNFIPTYLIPSVGELMLASFPKEMNIKKEISTSLWWLGEKYDGIRFCWDSRSIYTRSGNELSLEPPFVKQLPKIFLEGECWFGRGGFATIHSLVHQSENVPWDSLRIVSFDIPAPYFADIPFEKRYANLLLNIDLENPANVVVSRVLCNSYKFLQIATKQIIENEGEGVILRKHSSLYLPGRNFSLIKLKAAQGDQEGLVVAVTQNGDVQLKLLSGKLIRVEAKNIHVSNPKYGDVVTFSFVHSAQRENLFSPKIIRIRTDVSWEQLFYEAKKELALDEYSKKAICYTSQSPNYWTAKTMRLFLEKIAKNRNLEPLDPETWYSIPPSEILNIKGGKMVLHNFKGGYFQALQNLFPEIAPFLDINKFHKLHLWKDIANRRKVFETHAKEHNLDPQNSDHWYTLFPGLKNNKSASSIISNYYNNNAAKAISDLFPNIGFDHTKVPSQFAIFQDERTRRIFFDSYASRNQIDPSNLDQLQFHRKKIMATKEGTAVLHVFGNLPKALGDLYPKLNIDAFDTRTRLGNGRKIFEKYAEVNGFNSHDPEQWYKQPLNKILSFQNVKSVLKYYRGSVIRALVALFGLDENKFSEHKKHYWEEKDNRRKFFDNFASTNKFDPLVPLNWSSVNTQSLLSTKNIGSVLRYYDGSFKKALNDLYPP